MTSWRRLAAAALLAAGLTAAMWWVSVRACGPDFEPEVFVPEHQPDNPKLYADGHLGIVQGAYFHADLVVAYRYLSGGRLTDAEKRSYNPPAGPVDNPQNWQSRNAAEVAAQPNSRWLRARGEYPPDAASLAEIPQDRKIDRQEQGYVLHDEELNCTDGAFENAIATLQARAKTWAPQSVELREWLRGQDAVFSNCAGGGNIPEAAKPEWRPLLRQDRAYQIAAAQFYSEDFDEAMKGFEAIGRDTASPWSKWGEYLAARAEVRKAASTAKAGNFGEAANFDNDGLKAAEARLLKLQSQTKDAQIRHAAMAELNFIEVRLNPAKRLDAAATALATPDPDFAQDMIDLDFLMDRQVAGDTDLAAWIQSMRGIGPTTKTPDPQRFVNQWKAKPTLPWLVAALAWPPLDASGELMDAAANVKPDSPAYETVNYDRAARLQSAGRHAEARALLNTMLAHPGPETMASTRNSFLAERMPTARTLNDFLADAPRTLIATGSESAEIAHCGEGFRGAEGCTGKIPPQQFDEDAAVDFNMQMPLAMWEESARSAVLPVNLREAVAWATWMRALGLGDRATVSRMSKLLPEPVRRTAGESDGFPATLALLRDPGLRPYLQQGVQRSVTYGVMEEFRDNWWCSKWGDGQQFNSGNMPDRAIAPTPEPLLFLSASERKSAETERARLNQLPLGVVWVGQRAIDYVKTHPQDKDAAEALALTVRATHYGCDSWQANPARSAVSKEAFEMLHRLYPKNEWAAKTKYYY